MAEIASFPALQTLIKGGKAPGVTFLHGEEGYYIDALAKEFEALVAEGDRDFNLFTLYAPQTDPAKIIDTCRRYPMFSDRQVVIVRELQSGGPRLGATAFLNALIPYVENPNPTTLLCLCFRGEQAKAEKFQKALKAGGGISFESKKLNDRTIGPVINDFITSRGLRVDPKALAMLGEFVGADLSRLYNEIDKLTIALGHGAVVTTEVVERNIGISKEYNIFELTSALAYHNPAKAFKILEYFRANPKANPPQMMVVQIFNLFANVLTAFYAPDKSDRGLMKELGFRWESQLKDVKAAMRIYGPWHVIEIINAIREFDANIRGNGSRMDSYDLFHQLTFHIMNPLGEKGVKV